MRLHRRQEVSQVPGRYVRQGVRPVFEHRLIATLRNVQVITPVGRDAIEQDVVMAAFHHIDRIDLYIAEMLDRAADCLGSTTERLTTVETLRVQPDRTRLFVGDRYRVFHDAMASSKSAGVNPKANEIFPARHHPSQSCRPRSFRQT